jgi:hypothetical protein
MLMKLACTLSLLLEWLPESLLAALSADSDDKIDCLLYTRILLERSLPMVALEESVDQYIPDSCFRSSFCGYTGAGII